MSTAGRADRLAAELPGAGIDVLLVTAGPNVRYLTGYTGSNGLAVIGADVREFVTDFRYVEQAAEEVDGGFDRRRAAQDLLQALEDALPEGPVRLGFEADHVSVSTHERLRGLLDERIELVPVSGLVERLRAVKSSEEVEAIRRAAALADEAFERLLAEGLVGRTERELALALENHMRELGARGPTFDTIVAAGPHGALPHAQPRDVAVEAGQLVVIDWGAELDGYCSDCTRTVATGPVGEEAEAVYAIVRSAQLTGLEAVRPGADGRAVDALARAVIEDAGHGDHYGHGLGHGVGIEVHEAPRLSQRSEDTLAPGNTVTVEPGIYLPGGFGVRIEDLVVVTDGGCELLTGIGKELRIVE